jgi:hypothetical protein
MNTFIMRSRYTSLQRLANDEVLSCSVSSLPNRETAYRWRAWEAKVDATVVTGTDASRAIITQKSLTLKTLKAT